MMAPSWALALAYWLHMLATVAWIGSLAALTWIVLPSARKSLDDRAYAALLEAMQGRLDSVGWFSLIILVLTGLVQMTTNPNYEGFLAVNNAWALAILVKHLTVLGMVGISSYLTWGVYPRLRRLALLQAKLAGTSGDSGALREAGTASTRLMGVNLLLSILILAFTALARAS